MATNVRFMPVRPEAVWDACADVPNYAFWVVGSKTIRDADAEWPEPGARFHHTIGLGPFKLSDHTEVLEARRPRLLKLRVKGRPLGTATVTLEMLPQARGTAVKLKENPDGLFAPLALNPLVHLATLARNSESLMRLEWLSMRAAEQKPDAKTGTSRRRSRRTRPKT